METSTSSSSQVQYLNNFLCVQFSATTTVTTSPHHSYHSSVVRVYNHSSMHSKIYFLSKFCIILSSVFLLTLALSPICGIRSQSIIYSITRYNPDADLDQSSINETTANSVVVQPKQLTVPTTVVTTTTTSSTLYQINDQNGSSSSIVHSGSDTDLKIFVRSKRFMQKMPRPPKFPPSNSTKQQTADLKDSSKNVSLVLAGLLDDYDYNQRPGYGGPPALITTNLEIRSMGPISELDMEYSLDCYFRQKWQDYRLRFTGNANFLSLNIKMLDKIWKPDTYFHTGKGSHLHMITTPNKFLRIYKTGFILYSMRLTIKSLCPMDLHSFPMDKQSCPLILGSYGYPNDQLVYKWDENPVTFNSRDFALSQFDIVKTIYRNRTFSFKRGNYSMLQVNFNLRRHVGYFLIQIYVPCSLIVVLSWVSFWINREATADRVGLGVTAVLTLSTFGLDSRSDLPRVSYATALDWYTILCFLFVVFTLLEFAGVHYFTKVGTGEVPFIEIDEDWVKFSSDEDEDNYYESRHNNNDGCAKPRTIRQRKQFFRRTSVSSSSARRLRGKTKPLAVGYYKSKSTAEAATEYEMSCSNSSINLKNEKKLFHIDGSSLIGNYVANKHNPVNEQQQYQQQQQWQQQQSRQSYGGGGQSRKQQQKHMPYCPKNPNYEQNMYWNNNESSPPIGTNDVDVDHGNVSWRMSSLENYVNKRLRNNANMVYPKDDFRASIAYPRESCPLKQTSSWPTLMWNTLREKSNSPWLMTGDGDNDHTAEDDEMVNDNGDDESDNSSIVENDSLQAKTTPNGMWKTALYSFSLCCLQFWYCFTSNEKYKQEMKRRRSAGQRLAAVNSVSKIDKVSRVTFPLIFFILNVFYWWFYINERNAEFIQWDYW